jgi:hypothetical protein
MTESIRDSVLQLSSPRDVETLAEHTNTVVPCQTNGLVQFADLLNIQSINDVNNNATETGNLKMTTWRHSYADIASKSALYKCSFMKLPLSRRLCRTHPSNFLKSKARKPEQKTLIDGSQLEVRRLVIKCLE